MNKTTIVPRESTFTEKVHIIEKRKTNIVLDMKMRKLKQEINLARAKLTKIVD